MPSKTLQIPSSLEEVLKILGENIKFARLRRNITTEMMAERAGMSRVTLRKIENGNSAVTIGAYASVLFCLGMDKELLKIAVDDPLGRKLQDAELTQSRKRATKHK